MIASCLYKLAEQGLIDFELLLVADHNEASEACEMMEYLACGIKPFVLPHFRAIFGDDLRSFSQELSALFAILREFYAYEGKKLLISPFSSVVYRMPCAKHFGGLEIAPNQDLDLQAFQQKILDLGYEVVDLVEMEGEVSFRGDIVDIFVPSSANPYRISFFDNIVEDIKTFDLQTQICLNLHHQTLEIPPALFSLDAKEAESLQEEISQKCTQSLSADMRSFGFWFLQNKVLLPKVYKTAITPQAVVEAQSFFEFKEQSDLCLQDLEEFVVLHQDERYCDVAFELKNLANFIAGYGDRQIVLLAPQESMFEHLKYSYDLSGVKCEVSPCIVNILTPQKLILSINKKQKKLKKRRPKILLDELSVGEYVVHSDYGVGIFRGIVQTQVVGSVRDFMRIDYQGEDSLLLPVENLHLIDRYVANAGGVPTLDRLGKGTFAKLKEKVKGKLFEIAGSIIALAAKRDLLEGDQIILEDYELQNFQKHCGFNLTLDQSTSIQEILQDLGSGKVMDRLLSGDVGFGKTEVAMNALYAVCKNHFQGALVVPTTLLASQHYATLQKRFEPFGMRVAKLDSNSKDKKRVLENVANGEIDILVATHSVLGARFAKLGLLIVDEEHKFGVKQKEKIKELSQNVHLLSMSATPIPRTLNMALSSIKGMSVLKTPPKEREGVKTFVKEGDDGLIKEVISREMRRGGQVFFIHNHIASIEQKKQELLDLMPHLRIGIIHSKVGDLQEERVIADFAKGEYDVLLCTSIIESGIHLDNANTMIVEGADRFGIADLHQLRGRVGRGSKIGFCYFLLQDQGRLTQDARKRLLALERNSYLGSGASLAYHDLEIRGGGNLLGEAQSGHIKNIGYGLYLKMLEDCINTLSGRETLYAKSVELKLNVSAYLNPELIASDRLRLELYRRLSLCKSVTDVFEIQAEIEDRFGKLDVYSRQFLDLILIKILGGACGVKMISNYGQNISVQFNDATKEVLVANSKDDDDVLARVLEFLRKKSPNVCVDNN
ncbi:transcription-repair coupling factor [Helicobacter enhydrae]|uniref:Transcription-repair-coupling factor n=1 Tax=Helicobacter enhydrae TaxID=222136 RepID=A0A1B1U4U7_9HELI|nr:DEAD/DEAH box helicase [Helicobacter enhydrae]ANV97761.1 transcription-repair coupling factor [Helicobacter enhydrae]